MLRNRVTDKPSTNLQSLMPCDQFFLCLHAILLVKMNLRYPAMTRATAMIVLALSGHQARCVMDISALKRYHICIEQ